jgi:hypothetical protein
LQAVIPWRTACVFAESPIVAVRFPDFQSRLIERFFVPSRILGNSLQFRLPDVAFKLALLL